MTKGASRERLNRQITAAEVRLLAQDGTSLGIVAIDRALSLADESDVDLIETVPSASPPVCRLMSYSKWQYQKEREARTKSRAKQDVKDIQFGVRIGAEDMRVKCRKAGEFLQTGTKVRIVVILKGREVTHPELMEKLLDSIHDSLKDVGTVEGSGRREAKRVTVLYAPVKKQKA
jgi:translation initiation factor IF-3